ncbi:hypothetical protein H4CHR_02065 [Variovorax sp. PBS-H4]|uniref:hypothetical protein n=1 Tax=Variovorax sp. PBS-H4 TaxID=434008 RepID=UPI001318438E|nr:hypothetical protein [Variovorax sp. PBS-H4]VTU27761.1 hypothetical protein H4CHR_02065 [Variovorax sp. PBS-H4]
MTRLLSIFCIAALMAGCATRPNEGPGSGSGANYVPAVQARTDAPAAYEQDLARCRASAATIPFRASQHDGALAVLDTGVVGAGWMAGIPTLSGVAVVGGLYAFQQAVYTPERRAWHAKQETAMLNCLAQKGYVNTDPSVRVTWVPPGQRTAQSALRSTGRDTYSAEQFAKARRCSVLPMAVLVEKGPGYERHSIPCINGQTMAVRCEFGNCRAG